MLRFYRSRPPGAESVNISDETRAPEGEAPWWLGNEQGEEEEIANRRTIKLCIQVEPVDN